MSKDKQPSTAGAEDGVSAKEIQEIFNGLYGDEREYEELMREHYDFTHYHQLKMEADKETIAARRLKRQQLCEARRLEEEMRRIKEMRDNPANLFMCAAKIQKFVRRNNVMREYGRVRASLGEKPQKHALVIIANNFEDRRVRVDVQAISDAFDLAKTMLCLGFRVDILCDTPPYDEFLNWYDEPISITCEGGARSTSPPGSPSPSPQPQGGNATTVNANGTSSIMRSIRPPTRQNILSALETAARLPSDTLLWVHVCSVGGRATVNGKNPSRLAADAAVRTPRTRLLTALTAAQQAKGGGAAAAAMDTCHFIFPSDGRSARLTFENIIRIDEVMEVLSPKHSEQVFGHPLHQRIVTIDVSPIGCVEGHQGGGFACFASTASNTHFWEFPSKDVTPQVLAAEGSRGCSLGEPLCGLLTHGVLQCLVGQSWCRIDGTPRLFCGHLCSYVSRLIASHGVQAEQRRLKCWGDFPILEGDKLSPSILLLERVYGMSTTALASAFSNTSTQNPAGSAVPAARRSQPRGAMNPRGAVFEVSMRLDFSDDRNGVKGFDVFDSEFPQLFTQLLLFWAQPDPVSSPQHRQLRISALRSSPSRSILIGINSTFVEVSAKTKGRGGDAGVWSELVTELTGLPTPPPFAVNVAKAHEGGGILLTILTPRGDVLDRVLSRLAKIPEILNGIAHNAVMIEVRAEFYSTMFVLEQLALRARNISMSPSPSGLVTPVVIEPADGSSKTNTPKADLPLSPPRAPTFSTAPNIESEAPVNSSNAHSGSVVSERSKSFSKYKKRVENPFGADLTSGQYLVLQQRVSDAINIAMTFTPATIASIHSTSVSNAWAEYVDYLCGTLNIKNTRNVKLLKHKLGALRITSVRALTGRLNDFEDQGYSMMARRDRPPTPLATHGGMPLCVVAMYNGSGEAKSRQALHLHRVASVLELVCGMRFVIWDVLNETYGVVAAAPHQKLPAEASGAAQASLLRANLMKFLEQVKLSIGTNSGAYPCLMIWDVYKKRYYRLKAASTAGGAATHSKPPFLTAITSSPSFAPQQSMMAQSRLSMTTTPTSENGPGPLPTHTTPHHHHPTAHHIFTSAAIAHFCDEYMKGGLNDLLPPVKGSKVIGGGHSATKYSLISL